MRTLEPHRDAGAYALGVLDRADAFRFEDHLMACPACVLTVDEFAGTARVLGHYSTLTPSVVGPLAAPSPPSSSGCCTVTPARARWPRVVAAGAVAVGLAAVGGLLVLPGAPEDGLRISAHDPATGVAAVLTERGRDWGTEVGLEVRDARGPRVCELIAVAADGTEQTVTTWAVSGRRGEAVRTQGGSALRPDDIDRFEVRTAEGRRLVTLRQP